MPRMCWPIVLLIGVGCEKQEPPAAAPQPNPSAVTAAEHAAANVRETATDEAAVGPGADEDAEGSDPLPVDEDFEEQAETQLTSDNLAATLDALEKEIGGEPR